MRGGPPRSAPCPPPASQPQASTTRAAQPPPAHRSPAPPPPGHRTRRKPISPRTRRDTGPLPCPRARPDHTKIIYLAVDNSRRPTRGFGSEDGGIDEFPLLRDAARSIAAIRSRISFICARSSAISASRAAQPAQSWPGAGRPGTGHDHAEPAESKQHDTPSRPTADHTPAAITHRQRKPSHAPAGDCLRLRVRSGGVWYSLRNHSSNASLVPLARNLLSRCRVSDAALTSSN